MEVTTDSARAVTSQKMSIEAAARGRSRDRLHADSELDFWAKRWASASRDSARGRSRRRHLASAIDVHLDACIQCKRCVRACREEQVNDVIGYAFRGGIRRSSSTSTIRWATRPASRAASACRHVPPAR
jgi:formate dehydrogenase major subunit